MQRYGAARTVCQDTPNTWPHPNPSSSRTMLHSIRPCSALSPNPSAAQPTLRSQTVAPPNPTLRRRHGAYPEGAAPGREAGTVADGLAIRRVLVGHAFPPLALGLLRQLLKQPSAVPAADPAGPPLRLWRRGRKAWIWSFEAEDDKELAPCLAIFPAPRDTIDRVHYPHHCGGGRACAAHPV